MSDVRVKLENGTTVFIGGNEYIIDSILSDGGASCLAYNAFRVPIKFEEGIGMPYIPAVIKEFYPQKMAVSGNIQRRGGCNCLTVDEECQLQFDELLQEFIKGAVEQVKFYDKGSIHSLAPSRIDSANNTAYTAVDSAVGKSLDRVVKEDNKQFSLHKIVQMIASLTEAVKELHDKQRLHLDIKPSNIFLFENNGFLSQRVALFDFDTVVLIEDAQSGNCKIGFSEGWSAPEQGGKNKHPKYSDMSKATDIFAIGAVLYWAITGDVVTNETVRKVKMNEFEFLDCIQDSGKRKAVKDFLKKTLRRNPAERAKLTEGDKKDGCNQHITECCRGQSRYSYRG
ncbi:MAG: protein kinase [Defluviitaleaceae bacterium]|nr:protein kinase [Defluviitaleaceae bacterium]MCL2274900.1 protein kinase [Defluviitaleaceae bacterium]